ncbi:peptide-methionine (S)-S-oxide reductase MsrA [Oceanimonas baumannii]|uniref:Peptide methionine sulfoxide reductase MsrA n=1 Tax=Oceanimonas baumannii TaxID=129578 RepID=A0A235CK57_9GAMM|nr:peptide-methionine (S)-S-oxide reductase MsrA [Oceanimonas baumannii]OYD24933.1 peptide-methionine (S)-S-oxide reductase [Oceanimonas baumannii]TDW59697.1 peptide-methionine (S)-S-oxide reductase [Oceanimonas baumannii]
MTDSVLGLLPSDFPDIDDSAFHNTGERSLILAGGCFWCTEAVYRQLDGVMDVISGYAGGEAQNANYEAVCTGTTRHAEAIRISYNSALIGPATLLKVFFGIAHDPTQLNRQGNDTGTQYRSAVFWQDEQERELAEDYIARLEQAGAFKRPIVTTLEPLDIFYPAEDYHQDYAARNPNQPYIAAVAQPKVAKVHHYYKNRLKKDI